MKSFFKQNTGFSLIEILVSVVVLSIGMMGLAGLQIAAVKGADESHFRHEASLLLMDSANRIRSNRQGTNTYLSSLNMIDIEVACAATGIPDCEGQNTCNAVQLAQFDLNKIACKAKEKLPSGKIKVTKINDPVAKCQVAVGITVPYYNVMISWVEAQNKKVVDDNAQNKSISLKCYSAGS